MYTELRCRDFESESVKDGITAVKTELRANTVQCFDKPGIRAKDKLAIMRLDNNIITNLYASASCNVLKHDAVVWRTVNLDVIHTCIADLRKLCAHYIAIHPAPAQVKRRIPGI